VSSRFLIVGGDGLLGKAMDHHWRLKRGTTLTTTRRSGGVNASTVFFDLGASVSDWPVWPRCEVAVLCAAMTNLEQCRRDPTHTRRINVCQTAKLAEQLAQQGTFVVFLSTNLVFDGTRPLRRVDEATCPKTEYGRQKADAEACLGELGEQGATIRLTKVFHRELGLVQTWLRALREGRVITPFDNMVCSPISLSSTVAAIAEIAERKLAGVWHLSGTVDISYAELARLMVKADGFDPGLVVPASYRGGGEIESPAVHTTLDVSKTTREIDYRAEDPVEVIEQAFKP